MEQCRRFCLPGFRTCRWHGSATKAAIVKAGERVAEAEARKQLAAMGEVAAVEDPVGRLQLLAGEADALLGFCRRRFEATEDTAWLVVYGRALESTQRQLADLAKLLPPAQAAKAEADEARTRETLAAVNAAFLLVLDEPGVALTAGQKGRLKHAIALGLDPCPEDPPLPPAPPGAGVSGALPGLVVAVELLDLLARRGPAGWSATAREDAEPLLRAASAVLRAWGEPGDLVDGDGDPKPQKAIGPGIVDAEVVTGEQR